MDIAQFVGMGIVARLCGYDYRIARHYPTRFVLQTICLAYVRRHDQTPSPILMEHPILQTQNKEITLSTLKTLKTLKTLYNI